MIPVGDVGRHIRGLLSQDYLLKHISVSGEVSNLTYHRSGHIYFTMKDETAGLSCVMWAGDRSGLGFRMQDGDKVVASGSVDVYLQQGRYQLYARKIELQGAGQLYERYLALKKELEETGMFDACYKQPIPYYARRIGVVTAPTGAAVQDIRNIAHRRNPYAELILYPALVQGEGAAESIVRGIQTLDAMGLDCLIVGRGGGSIEDLWAFNEEKVARAIFYCGTPVISAVGHETDTTIADLVADLRAPTPSAAAELAVCDVRELLAGLHRYRNRFETEMGNKVRAVRERTAVYERHLRHVSPENSLREKRQKAADLEDRFYGLMEQNIRENRTRLNWLSERLYSRSGTVLEDRKQKFTELQRILKEGVRRSLEEKKHELELRLRDWEGLSPIRKLRQGYSYAENERGHNIASVQDVVPGDALHIQVTDGVIHADVTGAEERRRPVLE
ncbi:MAG: exodeoxyribonuclease VII large subunit [Eubacterium sp.]|nr:exodeoxyribonuclease VII large subunit [Eubacterium sp.]